MSSHYLAMQRGAVTGIKSAEYTVGTSATTQTFELRMIDGQPIQRTEVIEFLEAARRYFENAQLYGAAAWGILG